MLPISPAGGARIVSASFGTQQYSDIMNDALYSLYQAGIMVVAAGGNREPVVLLVACMRYYLHVPVVHLAWNSQVVCTPYAAPTLDPVEFLFC
jgi:hypothetical protein